MKSVSRVINREPNVSEKLRSKVQRAIDALGYVPDLAARSLAGTRAFLIGILIDNPLTDNPNPDYFMRVQNGAYQACRERGYHLVIQNLNSGCETVTDVLHSILKNERVDGFLLTPPITERAAVMDLLEARRIPYVRVAPVSFPGRSPAVVTDDAQAAGELAHHFWNLGHRRIAIVNGHADHGAARTRRQGFLSALAALGCGDVSEAYGGFQFAVGIEAGKRLLALPERPTAIFAANDDSAAGVMSAIAQAGLKIPDDISVAGFDDAWIAKSVWPYLTTVHQPITEMAHTAATMLIERNGSAERNPVVKLDYALVVRDSTAPPADVR